MLNIFKSKKILKFFFVGILNTIFGYSVYAFLIWAKFHYFLAVAGSTILGIFFNFKSTGSIVFNSKDNTKIIPFISVYLLLYVLNISCLFILTHLGVDEYISGAILIPPLAILAFYLNSKFVF